MDKFVEKEIRILLSNARKAYQRADNAQRELEAAIGIHFSESDLSLVATNAENADNLEEAINCYIHYGEYSIDDIIKELDNME